MVASVKVTAILPVRLKPPGKKGIIPNRLLINIKKNMVNSKGINARYLTPIFGIATSSRINKTNGSRKEVKPLGPLPTRFL